MKTILNKPRFTIAHHTLHYKMKMLLLLIASIFLISCSSDDDADCEPTTTEIEDVSEINAPESGLVNEMIEIEVLFDVRNSCGEFSRFIEVGTPMDREISVEARYEGCNCNQVIETITATYEFTPTVAGEYSLNFQSGINEFITVDISITEQP